MEVLEKRPQNFHGLQFQSFFILKILSPTENRPQNFQGLQFQKNTLEITEVPRSAVLIRVKKCRYNCTPWKFYGHIPRTSIYGSCSQVIWPTLKMVSTFTIQKFPWSWVYWLWGVQLCFFLDKLLTPLIISVSGQNHSCELLPSSAKCQIHQISGGRSPSLKVYLAQYQTQ